MSSAGLYPRGGVWGTAPSQIWAGSASEEAAPPSPLPPRWWILTFSGPQFRPPPLPRSRPGGGGSLERTVLPFSAITAGLRASRVASPAEGLAGSGFPGLGKSCCKTLRAGCGGGGGSYMRGHSNTKKKKFWHFCKSQCNRGTAGGRGDRRQGKRPAFLSALPSPDPA